MLYKKFKTLEEITRMRYKCKDICLFRGVLMFNLGDHVVCPGHGVGQICSVETKELNGEPKSFYIIKVISNGMKVMIPVDSKEGVRALMPSTEVVGVFELLQDQNVNRQITMKFFERLRKKGMATSWNL